MGDRLRAGKLLQYVIKSPRPTQPPTFSGTGNEYQPKCGDALRLVSKGRRDSFHLWINVCVIPERLRDEQLIHIFSFLTAHQHIIVYYYYCYCCCCCRLLLLLILLLLLLLLVYIAWFFRMYWHCRKQALYVAPWGVSGTVDIQTAESAVTLGGADDGGGAYPVALRGHVICCSGW